MKLFRQTIFGRVVFAKIQRLQAIHVYNDTAVTRTIVSCCGKTNLAFGICMYGWQRIDSTTTVKLQNRTDYLYAAANEWHSSPAIVLMTNTCITIALRTCEIPQNYGEFGDGCKIAYDYSHWNWARQLWGIKFLNRR